MSLQEIGENWIQVWVTILVFFGTVYIFGSNHKLFEFTENKKLATL